MRGEVHVVEGGGWVELTYIRVWMWRWMFGWGAITSALPLLAPHWGGVGMATSYGRYGVHSRRVYSQL